MNISTMKMQKSLLATLVLLLCSLSVLAQSNLRITGKVVDSLGEPIIGASVVLKSNSAVGAMTDVDGNFELVVPSVNEVLEFSYIGMQTQEFVVTSRTAINVTLIDDTEELEEVVIVGYGQQKKASVVGAITQTTSKTLERTGGVTNLASALTGNLPGVITTAGSGVPGDEDPDIVIRSASSWNNSSPLILVDGIEREMSSVDINSVESISVLKDASATAVYGVKGANGVILITTKRGEKGSAKINVGGSYTIKAPSNLPNKMDSYDALTARNAVVENELSLSPDSWSYITPQSIIEKYRYPSSLEEAERYPNVDWVDEIFQDYTTSYNVNANISGGNDVVNYFVAADYSHEGDIFKLWDVGNGYTSGFGYDRLNVRSNLDFKITSTTKLTVNLSGATEYTDAPWGLSDYSSWDASQLWAGAYSTPSDAFVPVYSDGTWGYAANNKDIANPVLELATSGAMVTTELTINTDFTLVQELDFITKGLRAQGTVSWDNIFVESERGIDDEYTTTQTKWIDPATGETTYAYAYETYSLFDYSEDIDWTTSGGEMDKVVRKLNYSAQLYWGREYGDHSITAMGLFARQEKATGSQVPEYREDWVFRTTYNYANRYFFEYNGAYNGSEKFSPENRFAFFSSGALGWMVSEEKFMKNLKFLDMMKIRASYGEIGDDNVGSRWLYLSQWEYSGNTYQGTTALNASPYTFYIESVAGNDDIHWETVIKKNLGIDYSFFNGLIAGSVDFFNDERYDILLSGSSRAVSSYYGITPPTANSGRVKTQGYEVDLRLNKVLNNNMRLWSNISWTHAENTVLEKDDLELLPDYQQSAGYSMGQPTYYVDSGYCNSYDELYGSPQYDVNDSQKLPGTYYIIDFNGDGVISSDDKIPYGYSSTPQNTYNVTVGWDWKGFSVFLQFYGVTNANRAVELESFSDKTNTAYDTGSWWSANNTDADFSTPRWNSTLPTYATGTQYLYDSSYVRLKNAEVSYTFGRHVANSLGMQNLRVYLNGNNLWIWSRMPDDRESNSGGSSSRGAYPTMKRYNIGVKFSL
ncbi:MAG: TonB-dependent receptor [Rikenellaceae bacterium]